MRRIHFTKLASLLATLMLLSMLVPVLAAAAAWFGDEEGNKHTAENQTIVFKNDGTVDGYLYTEANVGDAVYLDARLNPVDDSSVFNSVVKAVYKDIFTVGDAVYYQYHFEFTVTESTYKEIYLNYGGTVSEVVYRDEPSSKRPGGIGILIPVGGSVSSDGTITVGKDGKVSASALRTAFQRTNHVVVKVEGDVAILPANALSNAAQNVDGATITVETANGTYTLPLSVLDFEQLAADLGVNLSGLSIRIEISQVSEDIADAIESRIQELGGNQAADAISFSVTAEGNGKSIEINSFGNTYVSRTIPLHHSVDANKATGVVYDPETGEFAFVPSVFSDDTVTIKRNSNSIYTVISQDKSFGDVPAGHWAEEDIHTLANKLVVHGVSDDQFDLNRNITRAEFAALVVRSLGLGGTAGSHSFSDVSSDAWYNDEVAIATVTGLVYGYEDGTFRPNNVITREELASLVIRAVDYAGFSEELSDAEQASLLAPFNDADQVADWGREELARAIKAEIVHGMSADTLDPKGNATRAQAVAMLYRYLQSVGFIN